MLSFKAFKCNVHYIDTSLLGTSRLLWSVAVGFTRISAFSTLVFVCMVLDGKGVERRMNATNTLLLFRYLNPI